MANKFSLGIVVAIALIAILGTAFVMNGGVGSLSIAGDGSKPVSVQQQVQTVTCEASTALTLTPTVTNEFTGAVSTDYNVQYYITTKDHAGVATTSYGGNQNTGAISNIPSGSLVTMYFVEKSATHNVYGFSATKQMDCQSEPLTLTKRGMDDSAITSASFSITSGQPTANAVGTPQAVGAGGQATGRIYLQASTANGRWGTTEGGAEAVIVFDYNATTWKPPVISSVTGSTGSASFELMSAVPSGHSTTGVTTVATQSVAYLIKTNDLANMKYINVDFYADALTASTNPTTVDSNIGITLYDKEMYLFGDGTPMTGYRNADPNSASYQADLGETNATLTWYAS